MTGEEGYRLALIHSTWTHNRRQFLTRMERGERVLKAWLHPPLSASFDLAGPTGKVESVMFIYEEASHDGAFFWTVSVQPDQGELLLIEAGFR